MDDEKYKKCVVHHRTHPCAIASPQGSQPNRIDASRITKIFHFISLSGCVALMGTLFFSLTKEPLTNTINREAVLTSAEKKVAPTERAQPHRDEEWF